MEDLFAELRRRNGGPRPDGGRLPDLKPQPERRREPFPLTDIQQAYLIGRHRGLELGGVSSQYYLEWDCPALDADRLAGALGKVVARHEALRTVAGADHTQRILGAEEVGPCRVRTAPICEGLSGEQQSAALERVRTELTEQVLPVDRAPMLDVRASLLDGGRMRLHLAVDLLFVDLPSLFRLLAEWRRFHDDPAWRPEPLDVSFRDYVLAEEELRGDGLGQGGRGVLGGAPRHAAARAGAAAGGGAGAARHAAVRAAPQDAGPGALGRSAGGGRAARAHPVGGAARGVRGGGADVVAAAGVHADGHPVPPAGAASAGRGDPGRLPGAGAAGGRRPARGDVRAAAGTSAAAPGGPGARRAQRDPVLRDLARRRDDGRASMPVVFSSTLGAGAGGPGAEALESFGKLVHVHSRTPQVWLENGSAGAGRSARRALERGAGPVPRRMVEDMLDAYGALLDRLVDDASVWGAVRGVVPLPAAQAEERDRANATAEDIPPALLHELVAEAARRRPTRWRW